MAAEIRNLSLLPRRSAKGRGGSCPVCKSSPSDRFRPFCSARCADIDLARWLNETYRVAGEPVDRSEEAEESERE